MKKKILSMVLAAAMVITTVGICGPVASADEEKTKIRFQTWNPGQDDGIDVIIEAFEEEHPDIEVEYDFMPYTDHVEKLKVDFSAGDAADVFGMQAGVTYAEFRDFEYDMTDWMNEKYGDDWEDGFNEYCLSLLDVDGQYYALPLGLTYAGFLWANVPMLEEYGLSVPTSYDEMLEVCQTLRDNGELPLAIGAMDDWINIDTWMSIANDINSEKLYSAIEGETPFTDEDLVESFEIWQNCFLDGIFQDGALGIGMYDDTTDLFEKEAGVAMYTNGSWACGSYLNTDEGSMSVYNSDDSDIDAFLLDWNNDGVVSPITASIDVALCVNKDSENLDAALEFVDYMIHEGQDYLVNQRLLYCPSRTDLELDVVGLNDDGQENLDYIVEQANTNVGGYREMSYAELKDVICEQLQLLALGSVTPEEAAETVEEASQAQER